jgi:hypothetical protein
MKLILMCRAQVKIKKQFNLIIEVISKLGLINFENIYESNIEYVTASNNNLKQNKIILCSNINTLRISYLTFTDSGIK